MKRAQTGGVILKGIVAVGLALALSGAAQAGLLGLTVPDNVPNVFSTGITVQYDYDAPGLEGNGLFTATGWPLTVVYPDGTAVETVAAEGETFELIAIIDPTTSEALSGTLSVVGQIGTEPDLVTFFSSDMLTAFGFGKVDLFEFQFVQQGDDSPLAPDGAIIGVILDARDIGQFRLRDEHGNLVYDKDHNPIPVDPFFTEDFLGDGYASSTTFDPVSAPEPSALTLLALGALGLVRRRRS